MVNMMKKVAFWLVIVLFIIILLKIKNIPISSNSQIIILDCNNEEIAYINNGHKTNRESLDKIKDEYIDYILFIEDKSFYKHNGFDIKRLIKSIYNNLTNQSKEGASTITQQYIKNTYLTNEKSLFRKAKELMLAIKL